MKLLRVVVLMLVILSGVTLTALGQSATATPDPEAAQEAENKAVIEAYFEAQNTGDVEAAFSLFSPDIMGWNAIDQAEPDRIEAIQGFFIGLQEVVPDLEVTLLDLVAEGDKVAVRFQLTGTSSVEMPGQPAGPFDQGILAIYRLEDGLIVEVWSY
jgi:ketosteroid isomerase-like protein